MVLKLEPTHPRNFHLTLLDVGIDELFNSTALQTDQVVVVLALVQLKQRTARFEIAALQQSGLLELGEHAVHGRQPNVLLMFEEFAEHIFRAHVPMPALLENFQNLQAGRSSLEAGTAQFGSLLHWELTAERAENRTVCIIKGYSLAPSPRREPGSTRPT